MEFLKYKKNFFWSCKKETTKKPDSSRKPHNGVYEMIFKVLVKSILCLILFAAILNPIFEAESETTGKDEPAITMAEIPPYEFFFHGVADLTAPVQITLKGTEVDLSQVIESLNRAKQSDYDSFFQLEEATFQVHFKISHLCNSLPKKERSTCKKTALDTLDTSLSDIDKEMKKRILYPDWYSENKRYLAEDFQGAMDSFSNPDCPLNCPPGLAALAIQSGSQMQYTQLYDKIKNKNKNCQENILKILARRLRADRLPEKCLEEKNKNHPVCKNLLEYIDTARNRFKDLAELTYGKEAVAKTEAQAPCIDCSEEVNKLDDLSLLLKDLKKQSQCFDLNPGEEKFIHSNTGRNRSFHIKREPDGSYSVPLTLNFSPAKDYDGSVPRGQAPGYYMNKVQQCIKKANTKMLGPNGEKLRVLIKEPGENDKSCETSDTINISIGSKNHRSNAGKYASDIDCQTITHEVLHLLGLCDEYKEQSKGYYVDSQSGQIIEKEDFKLYKQQTGTVPNHGNFEFKLAYDCRITSTNSIMSNQYERWNFVFGPSGDKKTPYSLVTPGQFNAILYGGCSKKNKFFNECSQLAYENSIDNSDCLKKKEQCERQNALGNNKEEELQKIKERIDYLEEEKKYITDLMKKLEGGKLDYAKSPDDLAYYRDTYNAALEEINGMLNPLTAQLQQVESWPDR